MRHTVTRRDELIRAIFENMEVTKRGMHAQLHAINKLLPIPRAQLELLVSIEHMQPVSFKDLAKQLYLTPGAVSQLAEGLEQQGYIARKADPNDRRVQCLETTKRGDKLLQDVSKKRRAIFEAVLKELTDEELEIWLRVQQTLVKQFQQSIK
jgi:MarR family transcriptional regulator, multiple antibiotic resistance protein MarR